MQKRDLLYGNIYRLFIHVDPSPVAKIAFLGFCGTFGIPFVHKFSSIRISLFYWTR